jgi:tRNA A-37 threonylcarbamoyl transferase component Bud32
VDYEWLKSILGVVAQHGPWAVLAFFLVTRLLSTHNRQHDRIQAILAAYNIAVVENAKVTERLAGLIEERTRVRNRQDDSRPSE